MTLAERPNPSVVYLECHPSKIKAAGVASTLELATTKALSELVERQVVSKLTHSIAGSAAHLTEASAILHATQEAVERDAVYATLANNPVWNFVSTVGSRKMGQIFTPYAGYVVVLCVRQEDSLIQFTAAARHGLEEAKEAAYHESFMRPILDSRFSRQVPKLQVGHLPEAQEVLNLRTELFFVDNRVVAVVDSATMFAQFQPSLEAAAIHSKYNHWSPKSWNPNWFF